MRELALLSLFGTPTRRPEVLDSVPTCWRGSLVGQMGVSWDGMAGMERRERVGTYVEGLLIELERAEGGSRSWTGNDQIGNAFGRRRSYFKCPTSIPRSLHDDLLLLTRGP